MTFSSIMKKPERMAKLRGRLIMYWRVRRRISRRTLATRVGLSVNQMKRLERNERKHVPGYLVIAIAAALDVSRERIEA